jgi:hypothetical protein
LFTELEDQMAAMTGDGYSGDGSPDRCDALVWALSELMVSGVEAPPARFGFYNSDGITMLQQNSQGDWMRDPLADFRGDGGAGSVYASRPAVDWAREGIFHPRDREMWIRKGVYVPPEIKEKSS